MRFQGGAGRREAPSVEIRGYMAPPLSFCRRWYITISKSYVSPLFICCGLTFGCKNWHPPAGVAENFGSLRLPTRTSLNKTLKPSLKDAKLIYKNKFQKNIYFNYIKYTLFKIEIFLKCRFSQEGFFILIMIYLFAKMFKTSMPFITFFLLYHF